VDVPIVFPSAGGFSLTVPVVPGDECLLIFSDTCIDSWWQSGGVQDPMCLRRHDLSDAFAILGPKSQIKKLTGYSTDSVQLRNEAGDVFVEVTHTNINLIVANTRVMVNGSDVKIDTPESHVTGNLHVDTAATGTFFSLDNKMITVTDGIVTEIVG
jgi:hypothetical protein